MSYLVLARKWRPQSFEDLVGQEHVGRTLANAIASDRVHHAFLFTGARGVGKTSAARILAKALNCEQGPTATPCNSCPTCTEIAAGHGGDVFEIDGASNTGVDDVRELRENIRYLPSRSKFKIFIIDEVHMLSINAFNALLKTLEEPPEHAKFILATTEPHKIPVTILSRCQRFDFRKIPAVKVVERLREIVAAENLQVSELALGLIARRGEGSMRDALSTLDQVIAFCGEQAADEDVQGLLGMVDRRLLLDTVEAVVGRDSHRALESVRRIDALGYAYRQFCQELVEVFRALVVLRVVPDPGDLLDLPADQLAELKKLVEPLQLQDLERVLTVLIKLEAELANSFYPRIALEMTLVRLTQLPPAREVGALVRKLEELEKRLAGTPADAPAPSPPRHEARPQAASPPPPPPPDGGGEKKPDAPPAPAPATGDRWPGLVEHIRAQHPSWGTLLEYARLLKLAPPLLELGFAKDSFQFTRIKDDKELRSGIEKLAAEYLGAQVQIKLRELGADAEGAPPSLVETRKEQEQNGRRQLEDAANADPAVQAVLKTLGGEIREVRALKENDGEA